MSINPKNHVLQIALLVLVSGSFTDCVIAHLRTPDYAHMEQSAGSRATFWRWFQKHEAALFAVKTAQEPVCAELKTEMAKIHPDLTFEFGPVQRGRREFVISAGGIREAFPAVIQLAKAAPTLPRWQIVRFRPRTAPMRIEMNGLIVDPAQVEVLINQSGGKIDLTVSIPGYKSTANQDYEQIGYLLLDHSLGEYTMETRIGAIEFVAPSTRPKGNWHSFHDVPRIVDAIPNR